MFYASSPPPPFHLEPGGMHGCKRFLAERFISLGVLNVGRVAPDAPQRNAICVVLRVLDTVVVVEYDILGGALGFELEGRAGVSCLLPSPRALSMADHLPTLCPLVPRNEPNP